MEIAKINVVKVNVAMLISCLGCLANWSIYGVVTLTSYLINFWGVSVHNTEIYMGCNIIHMKALFLLCMCRRGYWKSFTDGIQRVLLFTPDEEVIYRIRSANTFSLPKVEVSLSLKAVGLSLVDNKRKQELAYISVQP